MDEQPLRIDDVHLVFTSAYMGGAPKWTEVTVIALTPTHVQVSMASPLWDTGTHRVEWWALTEFHGFQPSRLGRLVKRRGLAGLFCCKKFVRD